MTEEFKRGLILGLSMQPLCVLTAPAPRPVIDTSFNGNMINTGADSAVTTPKDQIKLSGTNQIEVDANGYAVNGADYDNEGLSLNGYIQG